MSSHFENKDALAHVVEKRAEGILSLAESHGTELPGHISAAADSARETAFILLLFWILMHSSPHMLFGLIALSLGYLAWKTGRSAWLGWTRLERLHRVIEQEKFEIEHHRPQEREELSALYRAKGFEGELLEQVIDVLMADQDRLLKVMLEEELGLTLQAYEHPIKQAVGAFAGTFLSSIFCLLLYFFLPSYGMVIASLTTVIVAATVSAVYEKNRVISAIIWNLAILMLGIGITYFVLNMLR